MDIQYREYSMQNEYTFGCILFKNFIYLQSYLKCILFYKCSTFFRFLVQMHRSIFFKLKFYLISPAPHCHYRCNTFIMKGCNRFKILLRFQIFSIKSNENMVWACHLPKRWECPTIFGRKFLEIYVVRR